MVLKPSDWLLTEKVAIVTGGGEGIGKAISLAYATHGAAVVVAEIDAVRARDTVSEIERIGGRAVAAVVDVREAGQVAAMSSIAYDTFGHVDILVNNVGDFIGPRGEFADSNEDDWDAQYRINLHHVFLSCKAIVPRMIQRRAGGAIINVSTVEAFRAMPQLAVYSAFKGAITQFTKSLALEVIRYGIRVNAIAPDTTETPQVPISKWVPVEQHHMFPIWYPAGGPGRPDDIAAAAVFLASDVSRFVIGTTIHVDGGTLAAGGRFLNDKGEWTARPAKP